MEPMTPKFCNDSKFCNNLVTNVLEREKKTQAKLHYKRDA